MPATMLAWRLHGRGIDQFGVDGAPVREATPTCGPDQLLARVDAVGLCASDAKMVRLGREYPLFAGRDLSASPAQLGHEVSLTVVEVGAAWRDHYHPGQRLGMQPDVFYQGQRLCFGVILPGGMAQYVTLGPEVLAGDAGSYVFPIPARLSYADVALLEPWACVEAAYTPFRRLQPLPGGTMWIRGDPGDDSLYTLGRPIASGRIILTAVPEPLVRHLQNLGVDTIFADEALDAAGLMLAHTDGRGFDDIILLNPQSSAAVSAAARCLVRRGTLNIVRSDSLDGPVPVDIGRLHYDFLAYLGCTGPDVTEAYGRQRNRSDLRPGGVVLIYGAGGPMGHMHVQRALTVPEGPRGVIATNRGLERLDFLRERFIPLAEEHGRSFYPLSPTAEPERLAQLAGELTGGRGVDDIVMMVPDPAAVSEAIQYLAPDGMLNLFAGVPPGREVPLPLNDVYRHGMQLAGTSGSTLAHVHQVLDRAEAGELAPARVVAAVGGLRSVAEGLRAVQVGRFPGKIVIFPQLIDLPLMGLPDLQEHLPQVHERLGPAGTWTLAAERALFAHYEPPAGSKPEVA